MSDGHDFILAAFDRAITEVRPNQSPTKAVSDHLSIPYRLRDALAEAEQHANDVKRHAGLCPSGWLKGEAEAYYQWWVETFGASRQEFEEMAAALARSYHRTRRWERKKRQRIMGDYIRVKGILTSGSGLETVWRS